MKYQFECKEITKCCECYFRNWSDKFQGEMKCSLNGEEIPNYNVISPLCELIKLDDKKRL